MKFKKLASMVLAFTMVLCMATSAFAIGGGGSTTTDPGTGSSGSSSSSSGTTTAAEDTDTSKNLDVSTSIKTPTLKLEVATTNEVIINPYQIAVSVNNKPVTDPIISAPFVLKNLSDCELEMKVSATLEVADTITVLNKAPGSSSKSTTKDVYVVLAAARTKANKATNLTVNSAGTDVETVVGDTFATPTNNEVIKGAVILKKGEAVSLAKNIILPQTDGADKNANYVTFQFKGEVNGNVATPWAATDTISVKVVLDFTPKTPTQKPTTTTTEE